MQTNINKPIVSLIANLSPKVFVHQLKTFLEPWYLPTILTFKENLTRQSLNIERNHYYYYYYYY